jgi:hypothetical protein
MRERKRFTSRFQPEQQLPVAVLGAAVAATHYGHSHATEGTPTVVNAPSNESLPLR